MKIRLMPARRPGLLVFLLMAIVIAQGCATRVDWGGRVGVFSSDEAVKEMGPPEKRATLTDGSEVCEWLVQRGSTYNNYYRSRQGPFLETGSTTTGSDEYVRLTFGKDGKLTEWRYVWK